MLTETEYNEKADVLRAIMRDNPLGPVTFYVQRYADMLKTEKVADPNSVTHIILGAKFLIPSSGACAIKNPVPPILITDMPSAALARWAKAKAHEVLEVLVHVGQISWDEMCGLMTDGLSGRALAEQTLFWYRQGMQAEALRRWNIDTPKPKFLFDLVPEMLQRYREMERELGLTDS